jgi:hypothetical protein
MKISSIFQIILLGFVFLFFLPQSDGQVYDRRGKAIYLELGGNAFAYSVNFDIRFKEQTGGLGARVGFSTVGDWIATPVMLTYMTGKKDSNHFFEFGGGVTYFNYEEPYVVGNKSLDQQFSATFAFMYRRQPRYGKFVFRVGITPLVGYWDWQAGEDSEATLGVLPMFGMSFGRAF